VDASLEGAVYAHDKLFDPFGQPGGAPMRTPVGPARTPVPPEEDRPKREPGPPLFKNVLPFKPPKATRVQLEVDELVRRLDAQAAGKTYEGWDWWKAHCPSHSDGRPSMTFHWNPTRSRYVFKCHAECEPGAIESAMLTWLDAHPTPPAPTEHTSYGREMDRYEYQDRDGTPIFHKRRYEPKDFRIYRRVGDGWTKGFGDLPNALRRLLYRLPQLQGQPVVWCPAGEKDVKCCEALGLVATTNCGGEGKRKWYAEHVQQLKDAGCALLIVLADNDEAGLSFAE